MYRLRNARREHHRRFFYIFTLRRAAIVLLLWFVALYRLYYYIIRQLFHLQIPQFSLDTTIDNIINILIQYAQPPAIFLFDKKSASTK